MHKLSLYLSPSQYEKLQILLDTEDEEKIEEFLNNTVYDAIADAWLKHKAESIGNMIASGNIDDETIRLITDGHEYEIWSNGEQAVITEDDIISTVQLISGHLHFVLETGNLIRCQDDTHERLMRALEEANVTLRDFNPEEVEGHIIA